MTQDKSYVRHRVLDPEKASPQNPVRGMVNDFFDAVGVPRPDEIIPTPAEVAETLGVPTIEDAIPTPKEVGEKIVEGSGKGRLPVPPLPSPRDFAGRTF